MQAIGRTKGMHLLWQIFCVCLVEFLHQAELWLSVRSVKLDNLSNKKFKLLLGKRVNPVSCFKARQEEQGSN